MREMVREERRAAKAHCARAARGTAAGAEETAASAACPSAAVLLMAVSMTSEENAAPTSIQVLIRTQEIKKSDASAESADQAQEIPSTFWGRVGKMFRDFWNAITGLFR